MPSALAGKLVPDVFNHLRPVSVPASLSVSAPGSTLPITSALAGKLVPDVFNHLGPVSDPASLYRLLPYRCPCNRTTSVHAVVCVLCELMHHYISTHPCVISVTSVALFSDRGITFSLITNL